MQYTSLYQKVMMFIEPHFIYFLPFKVMKYFNNTNSAVTMMSFQQFPLEWLYQLLLSVDDLLLRKTVISYIKKISWRWEKMKMTSHLSARLMGGNNFTDETEFWWRNTTHQEEKQQWMIAWMGPIDLYEVSREKCTSKKNILLHK